jgi:hypothetical protein
MFKIWFYNTPINDFPKKFLEKLPNRQMFTERFSKMKKPSMFPEYYKQENSKGTGFAHVRVRSQAM